MGYIPEKSSGIMVKATLHPPIHKGHKEQAAKK